MLVGAVLLFEAAPLERRSGGIDIERVRAYTAERSSRSPRARQRARELVLGRLPTWVDDPFFDPAYHVRHVALPRPGDERQLKRLVSSVFSQALDPEKPPWELWLVEGLDAGRFALIAKADAGFVAGSDGFDPLEALVADAPCDAVPSAPRFEPAPSPGRVALMRAELARRARAAAKLEAGVGAALGEGLRGALNALERMLASPSDLPLTGPSGSHRRVELLALDRTDLRGVAERLGASPQAILLAALSGALRAFLARRGVDPTELRVRALTPIGVGSAGAGVAAPLVELPLGEADALRRVDLLLDAAEPAARAGTSLPLLRDLAARVEAAASGRPVSLCVTSLSAPARPLYLLDSELRACTAIAPLLPGHTLGISQTLGDDRAWLAFCGDGTLAADLPLLADSLAASLDELRRHASAPVHRGRPRAEKTEAPDIGAEA